MIATENDLNREVLERLRAATESLRRAQRAFDNRELAARRHQRPVLRLIQGGLDETGSLREERPES
jgi:hypothetical protein